MPQKDVSQQTKDRDRRKEGKSSQALQYCRHLIHARASLGCCGFWLEPQAAVLSPKSPKDSEAIHIRLSKTRTSAHLPWFTCI